MPKPFRRLSQREVRRDQAHDDARDRLSKQCIAVLEALAAAPAVTNRDLAKISHRFGARIYDLRRRGFQIARIFEDHASGLVEYRLLDRRAVRRRQRGSHPQRRRAA